MGAGVIEGDYFIDGAFHVVKNRKELKALAWGLEDVGKLVFVLDLPDCAFFLGKYPEMHELESTDAKADRLEREVKDLRAKVERLERERDEWAAEAIQGRGRG